MCEKLSQVPQVNLSLSRIVLGNLNRGIFFYSQNKQNTYFPHLGNFFLFVKPQYSNNRSSIYNRGRNWTETGIQQDDYANCQKNNRGQRFTTDFNLSDGCSIDSFCPSAVPITIDFYRNAFLNVRHQDNFPSARTFMLARVNLNIHFQRNSEGSEPKKFHM